MQIYFAAAEVAPFAKVGGLADVAGSLPISLLASGVPCEVLMPLYATIDHAQYNVEDTGETFEFTMAGKQQVVAVWRTTLPNSDVPVTMFSHDAWIGNGGVYAESSPEDLLDVEPNLPRFALFSFAVAAYVNKHAKPGDILHAHDWHTGIATALLKSTYATPGVKTIHTIHNLAYQGGYGIQAVQKTLGSEGIKRFPKEAILPGTGSEWLNCLLAGILSADYVSTVSPTYRNEILTKEFGAGVENFLQQREEHLFGIVNGIDTVRWNPATDPSLHVTYDTASLEKKKANKLQLQDEVGLTKKDEPFMVGMVTRIAEQKGFDILIPALSTLLQDIPRMQFVILGTGDPQYTEDLKALEARFPDQMVFLNRFDEDLAHRIYAASDAFYMPSRFEPCGLGQLFAMRYGTLPIARATGGLKDTVVANRTGFVFDAYEAAGVAEATAEAARLFSEEPAMWNEMVQHAMDRDSSWAASAEQYKKLYQQISAA